MSTAQSPEQPNSYSNLFQELCGPPQNILSRFGGLLGGITLQNSRNVMRAILDPKNVLNFVILLVQWSYYLTFFGTNGYYQNKYQYIPGDVQSSSDQWATVSTKIVGNWRIVLRMSPFLFPASMGFLQISRVVDNPIARMTAIVASMFSAVSLLSSYLYLSEEIQNQFSEDEGIFMRKWINASELPNKMSSTDFWGTLAVPLHSLLWSMVFFVATIWFLIWAFMYPRDCCSSDSLSLFTAILATFFLVFSLVHMFRLCRVLRYI